MTEPAPFRRKPLVSIAVAILAASAPVAAHAQNFDLECAPFARDGQLNFGAESVRYQIDRSSDRWCRDACNTVQNIAKIEVDVLILIDEIRHGDRNSLSYHENDGSMIETFAEGTEFEHVRRYSCATMPFGELRSYLGRRPKAVGRLNIVPADALRNEKGKFLGGRVGFEITVSETGELLGCTTPLSSGHAELDSHTCGLAMARMKFEPAFDREGHAIEGTFRNVVQWMGDDD